MAGEKRRSLQGIHIPTQKEIVDTLLAPNDKVSLKDRAFVAVLYLTGARIREIIPYNFAGFRQRKRKVKLPDGSFKMEKISYWFERHWKGLTNRQINGEIGTGQDGKEKTICLFENIPTEKRRGELYWDKTNQRWIEKSRTVWRTIPVNPDDDDDLLTIMQNYTDTIENQDAPLFSFDRSKGRKIITRFNPEWFPHLMRHARLTHLAIKKDWKDIELKQYTAWKDTRPSETYVHMQWKDLVKRHF
jgi:integrase